MIPINKLERKQMERDVSELCKTEQLQIRYKDSSGWQPGITSTTTVWSNYYDYYCSVARVSELNIKKFPYGNLEVGDLVLNLPLDTQLPTDKNEYQVKYNGKEYTCKTGLVESENIFLYYVMVAKL